MQRTIEIFVDGPGDVHRKYSSTQYSATKGLRILTKLAKLLGKPIGILLSGNQDAQVTPEFIGQAIEPLLSQLDEDNVVTMVNDILCTTEIYDENGKRRPIVFDTDFAGYYGHLFKLIKEVLSFQYGNFFAVLPVVASGLREEKATEKESTGDKIKARG